MNIDKSSKEGLPAYLDTVYGKLYNDSRRCSFWDNNFLSNIRTFFMYHHLVDTTLKEIKRGQRVMQLGVVFGNQIDEVASAIGPKGKYDIIDINAQEAKRATVKYGKKFPCLKIYNKDARILKTAAEYDVVICFMLLSLVPNISKHKIINNALRMVKKGGKVVFVDWHNPVVYHPLRYIVRMYNRLNHPFVEKLWDKDIVSYVAPDTKTQFSWRKNTCFGGMFQKLTAIRKTAPVEASLLQKTQDDFVF